MSDTKVLFQHLTAAMKAALWRRHLLLAIEAHPEWSGEQLAFVEETLGLCTTAFFTSPEGSAEYETREARLKNALNRATTLFSTEVIYSLFYRIGTAEGDLDA